MEGYGRIGKYCTSRVRFAYDIHTDDMGSRLAHRQMEIIAMICGAEVDDYERR